MEARTLTLAVLVSGVGTTLDGIAQRIQEGRLPARIGMVIADRPRIPALERAARRGLASKVVWRRSTSPTEWSRALLTVLEPTHPDLIVLAGFLSILPPEFLAHYRGRIINVHPSLLPKYGGRGMYGAKVHQAVLDAHDTETGATVHLVTDAVDAGPILCQERVSVRPGDTPDTLRVRLHPAEVEALAKTIARFAGGEWPLPYTAPGSV